MNVVAGTEKTPVDWGVREVLVGVLHTAAQLEANLSHRFYHIPAAMLTVPPQEIQVVALYQSRRLFGRDAGVRQYGQVTEARQLPRQDIHWLPRYSNPEEPYYVFRVARWQALQPPIPAGGTAPGVALYTKRILLEQATCMAQLYITSAREWELYTVLRQRAASAHRTGRLQPLPVESGGNTALVCDDVVGVYTVDGRYEQHNLRDFLYEPHDFLRTMAALLGWDMGDTPTSPAR